MKTFLHIIAALLTGVSFFSCKSSSTIGKQEVEFSLYDSGGRPLKSLSVDGNETKELIKLYSSSGWTASADSWMVLSMTSGQGGAAGHLTVTFKKNEGGTARSGSIVFDYGAGKKTVPVIQAACPPEPEDPVTPPEEGKVKTKVIAHRGVHNNSSGPYENSLESLVKAQEMKVWGCEFDAWITTDHVVVINHNANVMNDPRRIDASTYEEIKDLRLGCGEKLPTFEEFLDQGLKDKRVKLVLEIKTHSTREKNNNAVDKCMQMVKEKGMEDQMVYIAFDYVNCLRILQNDPEAVVQYLNGDKSPSSVASSGIKGIDYSMAVMRKNLDWINSAHDLGMDVNVWTVNTQPDIDYFLDQEVDFITTNSPALCQDLIKQRNSR